MESIKRFVNFLYFKWKSSIMTLNHLKEDSENKNIFRDILLVDYKVKIEFDKVIFDKDKRKLVLQFMLSKIL
jgi:hypothetical protein